MSEKIKAFPKIFHIGDGMIQNLFKGKVEITEKIDGSQFAFGIDSGNEVVFRSKGQDITYADAPKMFKKAVEQVERIKPILLDNKFKDTYFYCEYLEKPHHNILTYERIPKNYLYLFGVYEKGNFVSDYKELQKYANVLGIEPVYILDYGEIQDVEDIEKYLDTDSCLGNTKIEGIVVKNYNEPCMRGSFILPISMGKYVSEKFKEKHKEGWARHTTKGNLELFIEGFRTEARWQKAVQHLREKGELENQPRDIGKLMKEINLDIIEEETDIIKDCLFKLYIKDITRKATAGFAEWYKEQLLKNAFESE
jgi:hypothetical protein